MSPCGQVFFECLLVQNAETRRAGEGRREVARWAGKDAKTRRTGEGSWWDSRWQDTRMVAEGRSEAPVEAESGTGRVATETVEGARRVVVGRATGVDVRILSFACPVVGVLWLHKHVGIESAG